MTQGSDLVEYSGNIIIPVTNEAGIPVKNALSIPFTVVVTSTAVGVLEVCIYMYMRSWLLWRGHTSEHCDRHLESR